MDGTLSRHARVRDSHRGGTPSRRRPAPRSCGRSCRSDRPLERLESYRTTVPPLERWLGVADQFRRQGWAGIAFVRQDDVMPRSRLPIAPVIAVQPGSTAGKQRITSSVSLAPNERLRWSAHRSSRSSSKTGALPHKWRRMVDVFSCPGIFARVDATQAHDTEGRSHRAASGDRVKGAPSQPQSGKLTSPTSSTGSDVTPEPSARILGGARRS
jgi:hypothetical protein